ncbi:DUF4064 domain-containing protein [Exiguobacterium acetylicum]|uniref:DUF4064 domain-containing protein n=1 Tax=Exiguobacterium acetylicum TaxID=41170 RepID=UPI001EE23368|nr:DUF4064 domain-containing protein [Exiguobacterium acetylicum]UKS57521.1 DUF4064 domain-containing protein [Exiguobacterium acetylicum]
MKRTTEYIFAVIGIVLFGSLCLGGFLLSGSIADHSGMKDLVDQFIRDENITDVTASQILTSFQQFFLYIGAVSLLCTLGGIFSIVRIRKSGSAGKLLIITAILVGIFTLLAGLFGSLAYLIAGITNVSKNKKLARQY